MSDNGAIDRRRLAGVPQPLKESKWPRTTRRQERIARAIGRRQPDLSLVLEDIHDPHNVSAVLRTCDAVGVLRVHLVYVQETPPRKAFARTTSGSAAKWIDIVRHDSIEACYERLRADGQRILVTALEPESVDLYETDLTTPVALVFGNEMRGVSDAAIQGADGLISLPMLGMIQSLNISVACAISLYEAMRQRRLVGLYDRSSLDDETQQRMASDWLKR
jgi:tRNA (guanosine-2'-O-)-methyltransferase